MNFVVQAIARSLYTTPQPIRYKAGKYLTFKRFYLVGSRRSLVAISMNVYHPAAKGRQEIEDRHPRTSCRPPWEGRTIRGWGRRWPSAWKRWRLGGPTSFEADQIGRNILSLIQRIRHDRVAITMNTLHKCRELFLSKISPTNVYLRSISVLGK